MCVCAETRCLLLIPLWRCSVKVTIDATWPSSLSPAMLQNLPGHLAVWAVPTSRGCPLTSRLVKWLTFWFNQEPRLPDELDHYQKCARNSLSLTCQDQTHLLTYLSQALLPTDTQSGPFPREEETLSPSKNWLCSIWTPSRYCIAFPQLGSHCAMHWTWKINKQGIPSAETFSNVFWFWADEFGLVF